MLIKIINTLVLLSFCILSKAQHTFELTGKVITEKKQPISFCNIIIKGKPEKGVISDYQGNFNIDVNVNDTLLISYVGYETTYQIIKETKFINIILKPTVYNLSEVVIKPSKVLTAKQVIKQTLKNWNKNNIIYNKGDNIQSNVTADFIVKKNQHNIYHFNNTINFYVLNDSLLSDLGNSSLVFQTDTIPSSIFNTLVDTKPYNLVYKLFTKFSTTNKFTFEFGGIEYFNKEAVYHIKYHRKLGGGFCEGGGYYLISKNDFRLLYTEHITKDCIGLNNDTEKMVWQYAIFRTFFDKNFQGKYCVSKAESEIRYSYVNDMYVNDEYYYKNTLTVNQIKKGILNNFDKSKIGHIKNIFYKEQLNK